MQFQEYLFTVNENEMQFQKTFAQSKWKRNVAGYI